MRSSTIHIGVLLFSVVVLSSGILHGQKDALSNADYGFVVDELYVSATLPYPMECVKTVELSTPLYPGVEYEVHFWLSGQKYPNRPYSYDVELVLSETLTSVQENGFREIDHPGGRPRLTVNDHTPSSDRQLVEFIVRPEKVYSYISVGMSSWDTDSQVDIREAADVSPIFVEMIGRDPTEEDEVENVAMEEMAEDEPPLTEFSETPLTDPAGHRIESTPKDPLTDSRELIDKGTVYRVNQGQVDIALYDHKNVDGDIVTIYLNDEVVVEKLTLAKRKAHFTLSLRPGKNTLRLHAENLGAYAPNTVAIRIKTAGKDILEILNSDMERSEYFTLEYVEGGE